MEAAAAEDMKAVFRLGRPCHRPLRAISIQRPTAAANLKFGLVPSSLGELGMILKVEEGDYNSVQVTGSYN